MNSRRVAAWLLAAPLVTSSCGTPRASGDARSHTSAATLNSLITGELDAAGVASLGEAALKAADPKRARDTYERGLERFPDDPRLLRGLGLAAERQEDFRTAIHSWVRGAEVDANYPGNYFELARLMLENPNVGYNRIWGVIHGTAFRLLRGPDGGEEDDHIGELLAKNFHEALGLPGGWLEVYYGQLSYRTSGPMVDWEGGPKLADQCVELVWATAMEWANERCGRHATLPGAVCVVSKFTELWALPPPKPFLGIHSWFSRVSQAGLTEPFVYWLLGAGAPDEFDAYVRGPGHEKMPRFIEWLRVEGGPRANVEEFRFAGHASFLTTLEPRTKAEREAEEWARIRGNKRVAIPACVQALKVDPPAQQRAPRSPGASRPSRSPSPRGY